MFFNPGAKCLPSAIGSVVVLSKLRTGLKANSWLLQNPFGLPPTKQMYTSTSPQYLSGHVRMSILSRLLHSRNIRDLVLTSEDKNLRDCAIASSIWHFSPIFKFSTTHNICHLGPSPLWDFRQWCCLLSTAKKDLSDSNLSSLLFRNT